MAEQSCSGAPIHACLFSVVIFSAPSTGLAVTGHLPGYEQFSPYAPPVTRVSVCELCTWLGRQLPALTTLLDTPNYTGRRHLFQCFQGRDENELPTYTGPLSEPPSCMAPLSLPS